MKWPIRPLAVLACVFPALHPVAATGAEAIPEDFPRFIVPGQEKAMAALREMFHLHYRHYGERGKLMPTAWDEWLSGSTLWPAVESDGAADRIHRGWAEGLSNRHIDAEGYVASHQHASIAHQEGWPFPFWQQGGPGTWGWHFSLRGVNHNWDGSPAKTQEGWTLQGAKDLGVANERWTVELTAAGASLTPPPLMILPDQSPFIQLRWQANGLEHAQPFLEWTTESEPDFGSDRRFYFEPVRADQRMVYTMIPVYRSPTWTGQITRLRLSFGNPEPGAKVRIQALFTQFDTRHNVNNASFIRGCCQYFHWSGDLNFLRTNVQRMRLALRYMMEDLGGIREKCIVTPFVGHDGRSGIELTPDGKKIIHSGRGTGNNYWDILPMGYQDAYATIQYYDALRKMAWLEQEIAGHPQWNLPAGPLAFDPEGLIEHAGDVKRRAGDLFWNTRAGRFVAGIDCDGVAHDYGFTFVNCEAIYYGFATEVQSESIMQWLTGERTVEGDTSQGADIYRWRFGPRSTTRRNIDWYGWYWYAPESLPWGGQVQDGGAVLGFSYHDLQARLMTRGADNAWERLRDIIDWFEEVQAAGGYRQYYKGKEPITLQGCGTCGGLGLDCEFYESILVPQIVIQGFLGFWPRGDGFEIHPQLPHEWPRLKVTRIRLHRLTLDITVEAQSITIAAEAPMPEVFHVYPPLGEWRVEYLDADGNATYHDTVKLTDVESPIRITLEGTTTIRMTRS